MLILIIGGAGSGKSLFAEKLVTKLAKKNLYYFATMQICDEECQQRVLKHQQQRAEKNFITIETPFLEIKNLTNFPESSTGLLECLSNLLANMEFNMKYPNINDLPEFIIKKILNLYQNLENLVIVTNDIFSDEIPDCMKYYLRNLGKINCNLANYAEIVLEINSGSVIVWKGENLFHEIMG
ncbi:MAG: bifunctional adenosylcobinamide kinase/adenosylcobinamide-phosphate guanylyltransferase [Oscillospiraceae bacterium]|nr:bifunctional adenosylcobinamide kinase/adenosylcobinamide-phosphate guanylyltransferase [Oscillospiraceae bacterium]